MFENHRDLGAKITVPFASNVYFCCDDNKHINDYANSPMDVHERFGKEGLRCEILYVGDTYDSETDKADTENALKKFQELYSQKDQLEFDQGELIQMEQIHEAFDKRHQQLKEKIPEHDVTSVSSGYHPDPRSGETCSDVFIYW